MKRSVPFLLALALTAAACGGDATADTDGGLTDAERAWCAFDGASPDAALRFDQIFEAGLVASLPMDALNARASALRSEYAEQGMTDDEAVRAVSADLLEDEVFIEACKVAYAANVG
jgi:hypothetical protein